MGPRSDDLKAQIEDTRADLSGTMDEMGDRVSPGRIVARRSEKTRQQMTAVRNKVMGAADHITSAASAMSDHAGNVTGSTVGGIRQAPGAAVSGTQGNPLAAGLIAFGAGLLLASVLPASDAEQQAAGQVLGNAQPAIDKARSAAQDMAADLKDSAADAVQQVRGTATDAANTVSNQAKTGVNEVRSTGTDAANDLKDQAQQSVSDTRPAQSNQS